MIHFFKIVFPLLVILLSSCDEEIIPDKKKEIEIPKPVCPLLFEFTKKIYSLKDKEINLFIKSIEKFNSGTVTEDVKKIEENANKYGSFTVYTKRGKSLKIVSDIYIKDLNLSATKHEIFFLDECNIVSKMTKYAYRSKRINSTYYFLYHNHKYIGCVVLRHHSLFHKKDKWLNITKDKLALNWSKRIYNNIIEQHLTTQQKLNH